MTAPIQAAGPCPALNDSWKEQQAVETLYFLRCPDAASAAGGLMQKAALLIQLLEDLPLAKSLHAYSQFSSHTSFNFDGEPSTWDSLKMQLGFSSQGLEELFATLDYLPAIVEMIKDSGGVVKLAEKVRQGPLDLKTLYLLGAFGTFIDDRFLAKVTPSTLDFLIAGPKVKAILRLLLEAKKVRIATWISPEEVDELNRFFEERLDILSQGRRDAKHVASLLECIELLSHFTPGTLNYLRDNGLKGRQFFKDYPMPYQLSSARVLQSLKTALKNFDPTAILRQLQSIAVTGKPFIRVSAMNMDKQMMLRIQNETSRLKRVILKLKQLFYRIIGWRFSHVNFLSFQQMSGLSYHGKGNGRGVYHDRTEAALKSTREEYSIHIDKLLPKETTSEKAAAFSQAFFLNLHELISREYPQLNLSTELYKSYRFLLPSFTKVHPKDVHLKGKENREMTCGQFVAEAIIEAHVMTCRQKSMAIPDSLAFYGFRATENLSRITHIRAVQVLQKRGILERIA